MYIILITSKMTVRILQNLKYLAHTKFALRWLPRFSTEFCNYRFEIGISRSCIRIIIQKGGCSVHSISYKDASFSQV